MIILFIISATLMVWSACDKRFPWTSPIWFFLVTIFFAGVVVGGLFK